MNTAFIEKAVADGRKTLSEFEAKRLLAEYGIPVLREALVSSVEVAVAVAREIGFPVAMKACGPEIVHKTERQLVVLNVNSEEQAEEVYNGLSERAGGGMDGVLIGRMVKGDREFVVGMSRDAVFGPCVMFGAGGVFAEAIGDVSFRIAPLRRKDALAMIKEVKASAILGEYRGMKKVDIDDLCDILIAVGRLSMELEHVREIDLNPLKITRDGRIIAVDALVALA